MALILLQVVTGTPPFEGMCGRVDGGGGSGRVVVILVESF